MIVDAGGGTIDISTYKKTSPQGKSYEEVSAPQCMFSFPRISDYLIVSHVFRLLSGIYICHGECKAVFAK
jgi:hypothetical protein